MPCLEVGISLGASCWCSRRLHSNFTLWLITLHCLLPLRLLRAPPPQVVSLVFFALSHLEVLAHFEAAKRASQRLLPRETAAAEGPTRERFLRVLMNDASSELLSPCGVLNRTDAQQSGSSHAHLHHVSRSMCIYMYACMKMHIIYTLQASSYGLRDF